VIILRKKETALKLSKEQKLAAVGYIKDYLQDNFEIEIGNLQSEIFLDSITEKIGPFYYNIAVADSIGTMTERVEDLYVLMKDEIST